MALIHTTILPTCRMAVRFIQLMLDNAEEKIYHNFPTAPLLRSVSWYQKEQMDKYGNCEKRGTIRLRGSLPGSNY